jgi:hypothetical protein
MRKFRAQNVAVKVEYDEALVKAISDAAKAEHIPAGTLGERERELDHGTLIPLRFLDEAGVRCKVIRMGLSGLSPLIHYRLGKCIAQAADLLGRILWWGKRMPYYPQAVCADKLDYRHDGRANSISGIGACQGIVFGVFGVEVLEDKVVVNPHPLPFAKRLQLKNLCIRGKRLDIGVVSEKDFLVKDGNSVHKSAIGTPVEVAF